MSFELVGLGKLLNALYASKAAQIAILRADIRTEISKAEKPGGDGGDFYGPFWADAKHHVSNEIDLRDATAKRIAIHPGRARLYPLLRDGFLLWWDEKRRLRNVPFALIPNAVKARYVAVGLGVVKVENTLAFTIQDNGHRILCPYFYQDPRLTEEAARIGLWIMSQSIKNYALQDMRLLDVIGGRTYSELDTPLIGTEEAVFLAKYQDLLELRQKLRTEYG